MAGTEENPGMSRFVTCFQMLSNELNIVNVDHCYSKPWSSHPDASNARPLRMLFMDNFPHLATLEKQSSIDVIDLGQDDDTFSIFDAGKTKNMLNDCDAHQTVTDSEDDWEEHIAALRTTWSVLQNRLFSKVIRVLQADRLASLSVQETKYEAVQRRLQIDKAAKRIRFYFGSAGWDKTLIVWLHTLLSENLRGQLLTSYFEVLETLKSKIPSLLEHLVQGRSSKQGFSLETLNGPLKRHLDPVMTCINKKKLNRLPDNPLLLLIPSTNSSLNPVAVKRHKFWHHQLSAMGKTINIYSNNTSAMHIASYLENMITATRSKVLEVKSQFPGRPIILIGWHFGALIATHVALMELVQAVVCLGFPTMGVNGNRGDIDDQIFSCKTPTLIVVGQHASCSSTDTLEDIREKLKVETGLILVGGADDLLRMSLTKKHSCGVTQAMVDRCIMEEMFEFLSNILSQNMVKPEVTKDADIVKKQRKRKQKDIQATETQTRCKPQQLSERVVKPLKLSSGGPFSFGGQWSVARDSKIVKRSSPKKHASMIDGNRVPTKKRMLHRSYTVLEALEDQPSSLSKVSEAAAIASAPELSNLLQIIQNSGQQLLASNISSPLVSKNITTSSSTTITTTTALTLSRFLASSGFFKSDTVMKAKDSISPKVDTSGEIANKQLQHNDNSSIDKQTQILFCTNNSSVPLTLPISSNVHKSLPIMRVAGSSSNSLQIQQLLTSDSGSSLPLITHSCAVNSNSATVPTSAIIISSSSTHPTTKSLSPITLGVALSSCNQISSTTTMGSVSSGASVITFGSDSVFMKETSPNTSVPVTVSIDLGDIASGINSSVMRHDSTPRISLIPVAKQMPITGCGDKLLIAAPVAGSQLSAATLSSSQSQYLMSGKPTAVTTKTSGTNAPSTSIISVTSSQLQSTLSSNTGLITLKLTPPSFHVSSSAQYMVSRTCESDANKKDTYLKGSLNLECQSSELSSSRQISSISTSGDIGSHKQNWQKVNSAGSLTFSQSPASLIITSGNKLGTGQFVLQCQRAAPHSSDLLKTSSSLTSASTASETLGKVTSLLESSPITVGDKQKPQTSGSITSSSSTKQVNKPISHSVSSFSSSSSCVSQGLTSLKLNKTGISSYIATPKPSLPTIASTRTRKIKTPKQYDL